MTTLPDWLEPQPAPLRAVIDAISTACLEIAATVARAALADLHGASSAVNPHGETSSRLDLLADRVLERAFDGCAAIAAWASEEREAPVVSSTRGETGDYLVAVDPLDGSGLAAANLAVGTIFSVHRHPFRGTPPGAAGFLQPGRRQCAAGYAIYGPATVLVLTCGNGVASFVHDKRANAWRLVDGAMALPDEAATFAINASNQRFWEKPVQRYVAECLAGRDGPRARDFNMRWIGCMAAEVHRVMTEGGVYLYPRDSREPRRPGRLRLLYEAAPMAMLVEQAGGTAVTGTQPLLDVVPDTLHEKVPVILGARSEIERIVAYHADPSENVQFPLFRERSLYVPPAG